MFQNFTPYRYSGPVLKAALSLPAFTPCAKSQSESIGFVPHEKHLIVRIERKAVPAQALKRRVDELAAEVERDTGRKPGKKQRGELKEQAHQELIARAFPKQKDVRVMFLEVQGLLLIGSTSDADLDAITTLLVQTQSELQISLLLTATSPAGQMSGWLNDLDDSPPPGDFGIGRSCVLAGSTGKVRYDKHTLDCDNVRDHLTQGKVVEALALSYDDRISFTLTGDLQFKSVELLDVAFEGRTVDDEDAEMFLWRAELSRMLVSLIGEFGGVAQ